MSKALAEAEAAYENGEVPVGAVVIADGRIVGRGHNQVEQLGDPTAHAEMIALTAAADHFESWRLLGAHLYVTIEPCAMCAGAALLARVERIIFGARDPKFGACGS
ncbi:MAG: nucleoside deaminase, partial [Planctomycetes bacterium]|nr:nucleoside deaminase [Planctomycetota bacterium]